MSRGSRSYASYKGSHSALSTEDAQTLAQILKRDRPFSQPADFYDFVAHLFEAKSLTQHYIEFTQLAISVSEPDVDTSIHWQDVITGYIKLGLYDDAYAAWVATPYNHMLVLLCLLSLFLIEIQKTRNSYFFGVSYL